MEAKGQPIEKDHKERKRFLSRFGRPSTFSLWASQPVSSQTLDTGSDGGAYSNVGWSLLDGSVHELGGGTGIGGEGGEGRGRSGEGDNGGGNLHLEIKVWFGCLWESCGFGSKLSCVMNGRWTLFVVFVVRVCVCVFARLVSSRHERTQRRLDALRVNHKRHRTVHITFAAFVALSVVLSSYRRLSFVSCVLVAFRHAPMTSFRVRSKMGKPHTHRHRRRQTNI